MCFRISFILKGWGDFLNIPVIKILTCSGWDLHLFSQVMEIFLISRRMNLMCVKFLHSGLYLMLPISQKLNEIHLHVTPGHDFPSFCFCDMLITIGRVDWFLTSYILSQCTLFQGITLCWFWHLPSYAIGKLNCPFCLCH